MKLTNKQKRSVKRRVQLEQGVSTPGTRVFVSKKIYTRKIIVKVILKYNHPNNKSCLCELEYKLNTNQNG